MRMAVSVAFWQQMLPFCFWKEFWNKQYITLDNSYRLLYTVCNRKEKP